MARLYANENLPLPVVGELRRLGHDVLTTYWIFKPANAINLTCGRVIDPPRIYCLKAKQAA
ncbi:MAG: hypothetical protein E3J21_06900 [Anaerolineales bacterium]|nr:MAG: hypothetical protein E3J21_06900 [Anaerolineales bacterium]